MDKIEWSMKDKHEVSFFDVLKYVLIYALVLGSFILLMNYIIARDEARRHDDVRRPAEQVSLLVIVSCRKEVSELMEVAPHIS